MIEFINTLTDPQIFLIMVLGSIGAAWTIFCTLELLKII
jgi:hypothetical protein